jgi:hypothetical protein
MSQISDCRTIQILTPKLCLSIVTHNFGFSPVEGELGLLNYSIVQATKIDQLGFPLVPFVVHILQHNKMFSSIVTSLPKVVDTSEGSTIPKL